MVHEPHPWVTWASNLRCWGIAPFVAALMEGLNPLREVLAQVLHGGTPLLTSQPNSPQWQALLQILEDEKTQREFLQLLLEES